MKLIKKNVEVFLGGTCNNSKWREELIPLLDIDYFNPVVEKWTEEAKAVEKKKRKTCDFLLYCITPKMKGVYSIAEAVQDSNIEPKKTIFCFLKKDEDSVFDKHQIDSLMEVAKMIEENGGHSFNSLESVAEFLNKY